MRIPITMCHGVNTRREPPLQEFGFRGNLFINTGPMEELYSGPMPDFEAREWMTWDEIRELMDTGWHIGSHTHSHPNLSELRSDTRTWSACPAPTSRTVSPLTRRDT